MILVDTSVWIDHLHRSVPALLGLLDRAAACTHPMVIGELALGSLRDRTTVLGLLTALPSAIVATHREVLALVEAQDLHGIGLSLVDTHLLAAVLLTDEAQLWTRDRRLLAAAERLAVAAEIENHPAQK